MKFRKKPLTIEARRLTADNHHEIISWAHTGLRPESNSIIRDNDGGVLVRTPEGVMFALNGSWIVKGVSGEFYPVQNDIFEQSYEPVDE